MARAVEERNSTRPCMCTLDNRNGDRPPEMRGSVDRRGSRHPPVDARDRLAAAAGVHLLLDWRDAEGGAHTANPGNGAR